MVKKFLTNFEISLEPAYRKAISEYEHGEKLIIEDEAYAVTGYRLHNYKALYCSEFNLNLSEFWTLYRKIREKYISDIISNDD